MKYRYICARFQDLKEDLKNSISKFRRLPKLADKLNCSNQNTMLKMYLDVAIAKYHIESHEKIAFI